MMGCKMKTIFKGPATDIRRAKERTAKSVSLWGDHEKKNVSILVRDENGKSILVTLSPHDTKTLAVFVTKNLGVKPY